MMQAESEWQQSCKQRAYYVYGLALLIFLYRFLSDALLTQMAQPPLLFGQQESFYKFFVASGIPAFLLSHKMASMLLDVLLFALPIACMVWRVRALSVLFSLLVLTYILTYNVVSGHYYHGLISLVIVSIPFCFSKRERFELAWEGARYYLLFIFSSAALWKIGRGSVFMPEQMSNILMQQQTSFLMHNGQSWQGQFVSYLIAHPAVSHTLLIVNVLVQLSFVLGFFTKRFHRLLFWLAIIFCISNFVVMRIFSFELLVLNLTLVNWASVPNSRLTPNPSP